MPRAIASWFTLALILAAGRAEARDWRCGATASFDDGSVGVFVGADDDGHPKFPSGVSQVEYTPGPARHRLELMIGYFASLDAGAVVPAHLQATVPVNSDTAGGQVILNVGDFKTSWAILPTFFARSSVFTMWIDTTPAKALSDALVTGGPGRFSIVAKNGDVKESQDLNILKPAQLLPIVAKAYPVAVGFAAAPQHSSSCEPNDRRPSPGQR